jgi:VWFA-related protein
VPVLLRAITTFALSSILALQTVVGQQSRPETSESADDSSLIRIDVAVVSVLCTVRDRKGKLVENLEKSHFEVRENGKSQEIVYFSKENNLPLTVGVLFDSSVSQERLIPAEREATELFFDTFLQPNDAAFLIGFDTQVEMLQDVTGSKERLRAGLADIRVRGAAPTGIGPFPGSTATGGTHLHDAVFLAAEDVLKREAGRKVIVLITDGVDQGSKVSLNKALEAAQRADVIIYGILFVDRGFYANSSGGFYGGGGVLDKLTEQTGGRVFEAGNDQELKMAFDEISRELRTLYNIGYSPANAAQDGSYRKIDVRVKAGGMKVQARKGYYAPNPK